MISGAITGMTDNGGASVDLALLVGRLGDWNQGKGSLYERLAQALVGAINDRHLAPGQKLPPERQLADQLNVSRNTVIRAYVQLRDAGLLESRQGSGSWVAASAATLTLQQRTLDGLSEAAPAWERVSVDLATASFSADVAVHDALSQQAQDAATQRILEGTGYTDAGLLMLREAIAAQFVAEGLPTTPDQILVTSGAQQSISLIARRFLNPGDSVVVEDPTSAGALDILSEARATIRSAVGHAADATADVIDALSRSRAAMAYLALPSGTHGVLASADAVERIGYASSRQDCLIVEDAGVRDLVLGEAPPYLAAVTSAPVLTVGSMSKLYWGGLRVGWIRGPEGLLESLVRTKARADLGTAILSQDLALRLLYRRDEIRRRRVEHVSRNLDIAGPLMNTLLEEFEWVAPEAGLGIWARLPFSTSGRFTRHAHEAGVRVAAGQSFSESGRNNDRIRVSLAPAPELLVEGLHRLGAAWQTYREQWNGAQGAPDKRTNSQQRQGDSI